VGFSACLEERSEADDVFAGPAALGQGLLVAPSTLTHHFRVLREAGVIHQREEGNRRWTTLRHADLESRFPRVVDTVLEASQYPVSDGP
jgi:DNA-binding transcriptional ArsR family regulator